MDQLVPFASSWYFIFLALLIFARGMDFFSTWIATPSLKLEANPIAKKLGWKWGLIVNLIVCGMVAVWPMPAIMISTTSVLVAAWNYQAAWMMRAMGEERYRMWVSRRIRESRFSFYLFCFFMHTLMFALVGACLALWGGNLVSFAIGWGLVAYAVAVMFYTTLSAWRARRSFNRTIIPMSLDSEEHAFTE